MTSTQYNPEIHHRRSIRMKSHNYAGGGLYFVTICAHREFIEWAEGNPFGVGATGARQASPVRGLIEERMRITAEKCPFMKWEEAVIMPDHMHALIRMQGGHQRLGDVVGGFKSAVTRELRRRRGEACLAAFSPPQGIRIWHRNYYEMIVRTPEAAETIAEYIRMNPWKLVQHGTHHGQSFRMIGNPALLQREKIGMLCSRNCPADVLAAAEQRARNACLDCCFLSGFHSPPEKAMLNALLQSNARLICCPAWGIDTMRIPQQWLPALEANRMLILEVCKGDTCVAASLAAAEQRNRFVIENADKLWTPHVSKGGMLDRLVRARPASPSSPSTHMSPRTQHKAKP